jgi:hypothetical protein
LAWVQKKVNAIVKSREKEFMKILFGNNGYIFRQRSVEKNARKVMPKKACRQEMLFWVKRCAIIYVKGGVMKHPCRTVYQ